MASESCGGDGAIIEIRLLKTEHKWDAPDMTSLNHAEESNHTKESQDNAEKLCQSRIGRQGPLTCATPAIADGRMYIRLKNSLACYDLRATK
jgi:hypothetical protein